MHVFHQRPASRHIQTGPGVHRTFIADCNQCIPREIFADCLSVAMVYIPFPQETVL